VGTAPGGRDAGQGSAQAVVGQEEGAVARNRRGPRCHVRLRRESIEAAVAALRSLKSVDAVFYAMKANANPEILKLVHDRGLNLECVSPGEIARVLEVLPNLDRKRILFTPNFAPRAEYEHALEQGVWVTLDNLFPVKNWAKLFKGKDLFVA